MFILEKSLSVTIAIFIILYGCLVEGEISSSLQTECFNNPEKRVSIIVELFPIDKSKFSSIPENFIDSLKVESWKSQRSVVKAIETNIQGISAGDIHSFWIANRLFLKSASCASLKALNAIPGVQKVRKQIIASLHVYGEPTLADWDTSSKVSESSPAWGVTKIQADKVWTHSSSSTQGKGITVANIDTGVRFSHEALKSCYRQGGFSWLDATKNSSADTPNDGHGHGTHTMGTICGAKGVGVAPGVDGMACKACSQYGCEEGDLLTCGQWVMCPYNKVGGKTEVDCSKRPKVVSCSWGGGEEDEEARAFYNEVTDNWKRCGMIPFFSLGNSGPNCSTAKSPADQGYVISVGATTATDDIAKFSSRGPSSITNGIKPEICAPGEKIFSAWKKNDTSYATLSGTSMSCPHVAGLAALLLAKNPHLTYDQVLKSLSDNAIKPAAGHGSCDPCVSSVSCTNTDTLPYPNNFYGHGRVDALNTYNAI